MNQNQPQLSSSLTSTSAPEAAAGAGSPPLLYRQQPKRPPSRMPQRSPPQNDYFSQITNILQDESIPENERWKQIVEIYGDIEPRIRSENPFNSMDNF